MVILQALLMVAVIAIGTIVYGIARKHMIKNSSYYDYELDLKFRLVGVGLIILVCVIILLVAIRDY